MLKKELEKLPRIPFTKEIERLAMRQGTRTNYRGIKNLYRYKYVMNSRMLRGILKIDMYRSEDIRGLKKQWKYQIFINVEGEEYISRERIENNGETTYKWRKAMIRNLDEDNWWRSNHDYLAGATRGTKENIRIYLKNEMDNPGDEVQKWQETCKKRIEDKRIEKHTKKWDEEMDKIPKIPNDFMRWARRNAFDSENRMYYPFDNRGFCTACQRLVPLPKGKLHHLDEKKCPVCHKKVEMIQKNRRHRKMITQRWNGWICCVQKYEDGIVVRNYTSTRVEEQAEITRLPKLEYHFWEETRVLIHEGMVEEYEWEDYKRRGMRWVKQEYPHIGNDRCRVYTSNLKRVVPESIYHILKEQETGATDRESSNYISIEKMLWYEKKYPIIEMSIKAGLMKLGLEMMTYATSEIPEMLPGKTLAKKLGIDNARMKRLKENNGGITYLRWLIYEKEMDTIFRDNDIQIMEQADATPKKIKELLDVLSLQKIANYCEKQAAIREERTGDADQYKQVLWDWMDFKGMMQAARMDVHNELLLKPADLTIAHNELVAMKDKEDMEKSIEEICKKYPNVNEICKTLKRYEYSNDEFSIVAPRDVRDILREGSTLKHCIHTCEYYFNRIEQRETYLLFLRRTKEVDTPWYTLEMEPGGNIRQKKSVLNEAYKDLEEALPFIKEYQKWVQKTLSETEKKLAEKSDKKRRKEYKQIRDEEKKVWHGRLAGTLLADALEMDFLEVS